MDCVEAILTRTSVRKYKNETVSEKTIFDIIKCGMQAPSAGNEKPWQFIVIDDKQILSEIPKFHNHAQMITDAACGILICIDSTLVKYDEMAIQDCSAATQNILLSIHANGLGGVWLGVYPRENRMKSLRKLLNIPEKITPFSLISVGVPAEKRSPEDRFDKARIHLNQW